MFSSHSHSVSRYHIKCMFNLTNSKMKISMKTHQKKEAVQTDFKINDPLSSIVSPYLRKISSPARARSNSSIIAAHQQQQNSKLSTKSRGVGSKNFLRSFPTYAECRSKVSKAKHSKAKKKEEGKRKERNRVFKKQGASGARKEKRFREMENSKNSRPNTANSLQCGR